MRVKWMKHLVKLRFMAPTFGIWSNVRYSRSQSSQKMGESGQLRVLSFAICTCGLLCTERSRSTGKARSS